MATKLRGLLKRELVIAGTPYVLTIDAERLKLVPKGKRKGRELAWRDLVSGEAALAIALNASLATGRSHARSTGGATGPRRRRADARMDDAGGIALAPKPSMSRDEDRTSVR